jgi:hypothetical protein
MRKNEFEFIRREDEIFGDSRSLSRQCAEPPTDLTLQALYNYNFWRILIYLTGQILQPFFRQLINLWQSSRTPRLAIHQLYQSRCRRKDTRHTTEFIVSFIPRIHNVNSLTAHDVLHKPTSPPSQAPPQQTTPHPYSAQ